MIINLPSQTELSGFYIIYEGSTNLEKPGWYGISHLMEHLVCKSFDHLQDDFERDGIDWNAYTSSNEVVFHWSGLEEKLSKYRDTLLDIISKFDITKKQFENERMVVLEEYSDYFNDQSYSHSMNLSRKLFEDYDPIGLRSDLENLKFMDCLNFFEIQFSKPSKIINVSKKKYKAKIDFADTSIDKIYAYGKHDVPMELNNDFKDKSSIILLSPLLVEDFAYVHFINSMLSMGLKSPLYQEVREKKGLAYYVSCYRPRLNKQGLITISTQTTNKNVDEVLNRIKKVLNNPKKYMTQKRFDNIKEHYLIRKKKDDINRYNRVNKWINPDGWSVYDILDDITLPKVLEVYEKYYKYDNFYVSIDKKEFNKK